MNKSKFPLGKDRLDGIARLTVFVDIFPPDIYTFISDVDITLVIIRLVFASTSDPPPTPCLCNRKLTNSEFVAIAAIRSTVHIYSLSVGHH